jgi:adenine specific DNA methylase Mod
LDGVFGAEHFRNEITWKRAHTVKGNFGQGASFFGRNTDSIFFYGKSGSVTFNPPFSDYTADYVSTFYKYQEPDGRRYRLISMIGPGGAAKGNPSYEVMGVTRYWRYSQARMSQLIADGVVVQTNQGTVPSRKQYLDEGKGVAVQALWDDLPALGAGSNEGLGYPTQKPLALLERIIAASSNERDTVLDPFCGCGTAVHAAQKLGRNWIGIDVTHLAISLIEKRMKDAFPDIQFTVEGTPRDLASAVDLAERDKYQFQWWVVSMVDALPFGGKKKGADGGIDGIIYFNDLDPATEKMKTHRAIISVKGGKPGVTMVETLAACIEREKAPIAF